MTAFILARDCRSYCLQRDRNWLLMSLRLDHFIDIEATLGEIGIALLSFGSGSGEPYSETLGTLPAQIGRSRSSASSSGGLDFYLSLESLLDLASKAFWYKGCFAWNSGSVPKVTPKVDASSAERVILFKVAASYKSIWRNGCGQSEILRSRGKSCFNHAASMNVASPPFRIEAAEDAEIMLFDLA